jgi:hypothetical protein
MPYAPKWEQQEEREREREIYREKAHYRADKSFPDPEPSFFE